MCKQQSQFSLRILIVPSKVMVIIERFGLPHQFLYDEVLLHLLPENSTDMISQKLYSGTTTITKDTAMKRSAQVSSTLPAQHPRIAGIIEHASSSIQ